MEVKAEIVVMSHLSDVQELSGYSGDYYSDINLRINFAKYIILNLKGNLNQDIDPDKMYNDFLKIYKIK